MKKSVLSILILLLLFQVCAEKIEIKAGENVKPGESLSLQVLVYDNENNLIAGNVNVILEDASKFTKIEKILTIGKNEEVELNNTANPGYWKITARYNNVEASSLFLVETNEIIKIALDDDILSIENVGNAKYDKVIQIVIGDSIGTKKIILDVGEKMNMRLTAPDGSYNIKITDGKTTLSRNNVQLTGNVIGVSDDKPVLGSPMTGISPDKDEFSSITSGFMKKKVLYFFLALVIGATILLAIERNYRTRINN